MGWILGQVFLSDSLLDNGIRNAVIAQFNSFDLRNDIGALWENFMIMEHLKYRTYHSLYVNIYFWRTYDKQEIDLVEEHDGRLYGYEFKSVEKQGRPGTQKLGKLLS